MLLTILIPTYNRAKFLLKNLYLLAGYIRRSGLESAVNIFISDNCSTDQTVEHVKMFIKENADIHISLKSHDRNYGVRFNTGYVLDHVAGKFFMYLGDDDFIDEKYFQKVSEIIRSDPDIFCVIPSFQSVDMNGAPIKGSGRDLGLSSRTYLPSFKSCLENSWRGHQISGVVCRKNGLVEKFREQGVDNMYPFIFCVAFSSLKGKLLHLTEYPVQVTQPGQEKKDWGYGQDGLVSEIFDNYKKLFPRNMLYRFLLEMKLLRVQRSRYEMYFRLGWRQGWKAVSAIISSKNSSLLLKLFFLPFSVLSLTKLTIKSFTK